MANIHLSTSSNGGNLIINGNRDHHNVNVGDATMPKYVGARAIVERVEDGVRITFIDYKGTTQETIAEAISGITTNDDGSLTFTLANGNTITTGSLKGAQGDPGPQGIQGPAGQDGHTPSITASKSGKVTTVYADGTSIATLNDGEDGSDGADGNDGAAAGFGTVSATVDSNVGTPSVTVTSSGADTAKNFAFAFSNIKGEKGDTGSKGDPGDALPYGECSTAKGTAAKTVSIPGVTSLDEGMIIAVKFTNTNTAADPTLQVNSLTAKAIKRYGTTAPSTSAASSWNAGSVVLLLYDGSYWQMVDFNNTTYSAMTQSEMHTGTATTGRNITAARLKEAVEYHAPVTSVNGSTGAVTVTVPTKVSDLQNDSGFITGYTETDPTVPSWAKASSKPSYTASEVSYGSSNVQATLDDLYTLKVLVISVASFSSLPQTVTNASITDNHVCIKAEIGAPTSQTGDWTVTTSAGSLTLSGSISGSTTAKLYLAVKA